jgi:hypothetical protein
MTDNLDEATRLRSIEVGYQKAIDLWMYEGRLFWMEFNTMLVINVLILTFAYNKQYAMSPSFISPTIGLVVCFVWIAMMQRTRSYFTYWALSARELENKLFGSDVKIVRRGALFGAGKPIQFEIEKDRHTLRMSRLGRLRTIHLSHFIALAFLSAHGFTLYKTIL